MYNLIAKSLAHLQLIAVLNNVTDQYLKYDTVSTTYEWFLPDSLKIDSPRAR